MTKNARIEGKTVKVKRQDIRIPIEFYDRLKKIAVERFNAPIHHRSGEPTITPTLLKLAELGIEYLESGLADKKAQLTTTEVLKRLETLEQNQFLNTDTMPKEFQNKIEVIEQRLTDNSTDNMPEELDSRLTALENSLADNNADSITIKLRERLERVEQQLADINTDKYSKDLVTRLERVERQITNSNTDTTQEQAARQEVTKKLTDNNTDNIPIKSGEEPELTSNNTDNISSKETISVEKQEKNLEAIRSGDADNLPPSSQQQLTDNNTDKNPDFYSDVKELLSATNDPDITRYGSNKYVRKRLKAEI